MKALSPMQYVRYSVVVFATMLVCANASAQYKNTLIIKDVTETGDQTHVACKRILFQSPYRYNGESGKKLHAYIDNQIICDVDYTTDGTGTDYDGTRTLNTALEVGTTAGAFDVSQTGAATYNIPILVPPGTAGMQPNLSLAYNSQGGSGILGMNWDLAGLSSIRRVGKTIYHNSLSTAVELNGNDRFALDGNRLIGIMGTYGVNNTTYGTESESFSTIKSFGNAGGGPEYFEVTTKDGTIMQYGKTVDSRLLADDPASSNREAVLAWMLCKVIDPRKNYMDITYHTEPGQGECWPVSIKYTGNTPAGISPYNEVKFKYEKRQDANVTYIAGAKVTESVLLMEIDVLAESNIVRKYNLNYGQNLYSHLLSVTETNSEGKQYNPIVIEWEQKKSAAENQQTAFSNNSFEFADGVFTGDFNGDGVSDIISDFAGSISGGWNYKTGSISSLGVWDHTVVNSVAFSGFTSVNINYSTLRGIPGASNSELNGDGYEDVIMSKIIANPSGGNTITYKPFYGGASGFDETSGGNGVSFWYEMTSSLMGDFDGDGLTDLFVNNTPFDSASMGGCKLYSFKNKTTTEIYDGPAIAGIRDVFTLDFNGNGKTDILYLGDNNIWNIWEYDNSLGTFLTIYHRTGPISPVKAVMKDIMYNNGTMGHYSFKRDPINLGDFNGDGKMDIFGYDATSAKWLLLYSTGKEFVISESPISDNKWVKNESITSSVYIGAAGEMPNGYFIQDINGDGKSDIVQVEDRKKNSQGDDQSTCSIYFMNGNTFSKESSAINWNAYTSENDEYNSTSSNFYYNIVKINGFMSLFLDANLDGYPDIVQATSAISRNKLWYFLLHQGRQTVKSITNGLNYQTKFTFGISGAYNSSKNAVDYGIMQQASQPIKALKEVEFVDTYKNNTVVNNTIKYTYSNPIQHFTGRSFLGFTSYTENSLAHGTLTIRNFEFINSLQMLFLKDKRIKYASNKVSSVLYTNTINEFGDKRYFAFASNAVNHDALTANTVTTDYTYNAIGLPTYQKTQYGADLTAEVSTEYNNADCQTCPTKITSTNTRAGKTAFTSNILIPDYYPTQLPKTQIADNGLTLEYTYTPTGRLKSQTAKGSNNDRIVNYQYDGYDRYVTKTITPCGNINHIVETNYEPVYGNPLWQKDKNGLKTSYTYDGFGRLNEIMSPTLVKTTITTKWDDGNSNFSGSVYMTHTETKENPPADEYFDILGRSVQLNSKGFDGSKIIAEKEYYNSGLLKSSTEGRFANGVQNKTEYFYTNNNQLKSQVLPTGATMSYTYSGLTTTVSNDKTGQTTEKTYDAAGQLSKVVENSLNTITYTYHSCGKPERITSNGSGMIMTYDNFGFLQQLNDANAGTTSYTYNVFGETVSQTDANMKTTSIEYDVLGRPLTKTSEEGTVTYVYDTKPNGIGLLASVSGYNGITQEYTYDGNSRPIEQKETIDNRHIFSTTYAYNDLNRITKITYPSGFAVNQSYNNLGYLEKVLNDKDKSLIWQGDSLNQRGQITAAHHGNGLSVSNTYNDWGFLTNNDIKRTASNTAIRNYGYLFDEFTGNLKNRSMGTSLSETFTYDDLDRLRTIAGATPQEIIYKDNGNIDAKSDVGEQYFYQSQHPHAVDAVSKPSTLYKDNEAQQITYTSFNKADEITETLTAPDDITHTLKITYGPDNERRQTDYAVIKAGQQSGIITKYYSGGYEKIVNAIDGTTRQLDYIRAGNGLCAIHVTNGIEDSLYYVYTDHLGSISLITDNTANIMDERSYDAWGRRRNPTTWEALPPLGGAGGGPKITDRGYTTHEHLEAFGLINMNGRMYDPILGRMLSPDVVIQAPEASQSYNRYSYCMNNPLKHTDPTGYISSKDHPSTMASDLQQSLKFELTAKMAEMEAHSGAAIGPETANNANDETVDMNEFYAQAVQDLKEGGSPLGGKIDVAFSEEQLGNNSMGESDMMGDDGKKGQGGDGNTNQMASTFNLGLGLAGTMYGVGEIASKSSTLPIKFSNYTGFNLDIASRAFGNTGKILQGLGKATFFGSSAISLTQGGIGLYNGQYGLAGKSAFDIGMGGVGFLGPIGFGISTIYFGIDATIGFSRALNLYSKYGPGIGPKY